MIFLISTHATHMKCGCAVRDWCSLLALCSCTQSTCGPRFTQGGEPAPLPLAIAKKQLHALSRKWWQTRTCHSHCTLALPNSFHGFTNLPEICAHGPSLTWYELATPAQIRGAAPSSPTLGSNTTVRSMNVFDSRRNVASKLISILGPCSRRELPHAGQRASACVRQ